MVLIEVSVIAINLVAFSPSVSTGINILSVVSEVVVTVGNLSVVTGASILPTVVAIIVGINAPNIASGTNVLVTSVIIDVVSVVSVIQTGSNVIVPFSEIIVSVPNITFVGMMPDGVDRPRVVSSTPQLRVSHAS